MGWSEPNTYTPWNQQFTPARKLPQKKNDHGPTIDFQVLGYVSFGDGINCWPGLAAWLPPSCFFSGPPDFHQIAFFFGRKKKVTANWTPKWGKKLFPKKTRIVQASGVLCVCVRHQFFCWLVWSINNWILTIILHIYIYIVSDLPLTQLRSPTDSFWVRNPANLNLQLLLGSRVDPIYNSNTNRIILKTSILAI